MVIYILTNDQSNLLKRCFFFDQNIVSSVIFASRAPCLVVARQSEDGSAANLPFFRLTIRTAIRDSEFMIYLLKSINLKLFLYFNPCLCSSVPAPLNACRAEFRFSTSFGEFQRAGLFNWGGLAAAKLARAKTGPRPNYHFPVVFNRSGI